MKKVLLWVFMLILTSVCVFATYNQTIHMQFYDNSGTPLAGIYQINVTMYNSTDNLIYFGQFIDIILDSNGRTVQTLFVNYDMRDRTYIQINLSGHGATSKHQVGYVSKSINSEYLKGVEGILYALKNETVTTNYVNSLGNWSAVNISYNTTIQLNALFLNRSSEALYTTTYNASYMTNTYNASYMTNTYNSSYMTNTYNATYAAGANTSWNETLANTLYSSISALNQGLDLKFNLTGGTINGNVVINGNMSVIGTRIDLNVTDLQVNGSFIPQADSIFDLGSLDIKWNNIYGVNIIASNVINNSYLLNNTFIVSSNTSWVNSSGFIRNWNSSGFIKDWTSTYNESYMTNTYNATYANYNVSGLIKNWNLSGYLLNWNNTGYIKDWNQTGFIKDFNSSGLIKDWNISGVMLNYNSTGLILDWSTIITAGGNASWNESYARTIFAEIGGSGDNSSWNESYADTKYKPINSLITTTGDVSFVRQLASTSTSSSSAFSETNLAYNLIANQSYYLTCNILTTGAAATTGLVINLSNNATVSDTTIVYDTWSSATAKVGLSATAFNTALIGTGSGATIIKPNTIIANFNTISDGVLKLYFRSEVDTSSIGVERGSSCILYNKTAYFDTPIVNSSGNYPATITHSRNILTNSNTAFNLTDFTWPLQINQTYNLQCTILYTGAAATTGQAISINTTATTSNVTIVYDTWSSATAKVGLSATAFNTTLIGTGSGATIIKPNYITAFFNTISAGDLYFWIRSEVSGSNSELQAGSSCWLYNVTS